MEQLERLFDPEAIAVIGASENPEKRGYVTLNDLQQWGYEGDIYPVNPNYEALLKLPSSGDSVLKYHRSRFQLPIFSDEESKTM